MKTRNILLIVAATLIVPALATAQPCGQGRGIQGKMGLFDTNGDGNTTMEEVKTTRAKIFQTTDLNSDGQLTIDELDTARQTRRVQWMLTRHDTDKNGTVSLEEFNNQVPLWFSRVDNNGDGTVTAQEKQSFRGIIGQQGGRIRNCGNGRGMRGNRG